MRKLLISLFALMSLNACQSQSSAFDPRAWKGLQAGAPTQILTLGSAHLSQLPVVVDAAMMSALIDKLAAYKPGIITVENVSGAQCDVLRRYREVLPDSFDTWCNAPDLAQSALGMDAPRAAAEIHKTLAAWPPDPEPAARRHLAALFLAAGETPSAVVQWRRLPVAERRAEDGVTADALKLLERTKAAPNETYEIGVSLAVRLGLERVVQVDDHTSDEVSTDEGAEYTAAIEEAWKVAPSRSVAQEQAMEKALKSPADVLDLYRFINRPQTLRQNIQADFLANMVHPSAGLYGRRYVAGWEVRNLRMVSDIRAAAATQPGVRVLNIVGSAHKPYYEACSALMPDVETIDAEAVLR